MRTFLLAAALAVLAVSAAHAQEVDDPDVLVLTTSTFDQALKEHDNILVEFYAPWCGHCKRLQPEYAAAATQLKGKFALAKVDATVESDLASKFGVRGYPTLKMFRNGQESEYKGGRTTDTIVSYLEKQLLPAVSTLASGDEAKTFSEADKVVVIGCFEAAEGDDYAEFTKTASALRDDFRFGEALSSDVCDAVGAKAGTVVLFQNFAEGRQSVVADTIEVSALSNFIKANSVPLVDEVGPENYRVYADMGLPLAFLFLDPANDDVKNSMVQAIIPVARNLKGKINFVWADGVKYIAQAKNLGLTGDKLPCLALQRMSDDAHFGFDESAEITTDAVQKWMDDILAGNIKPTIKSEEEPADNNGPVTVVVGSTFEKIAHDTSKDVLIEFYAPWCGHCKKLAPIWDELGEHFADNDNIVIAKMDATANDAVGVSIRGFPTIKFFPAGSDTPLDYNGGRELKDLIEYVNKNAKSASAESAKDGVKDEL